MFTAKFYGHDGRRCILTADSFTILADDANKLYEVTLHQKDGSSCRFDIGSDIPRQEGWPPLMSHAYLVNENGSTIETLRCNSCPQS